MTIDALSVQSENELRVWSANGLVGDLRVIIITPDSINDCSTLSSFNHTFNAMIARKHCAEGSIGLSDEVLKTVFADIQAIDEQDLSCLGPMDGPAGLIEILYSGRWVAVQYESPHECNLQPVLNIFNAINTFRQSLDQSG